MRERSGASWIVYALGALLAGAIVAAALIVGPVSGQQYSQTRLVTARHGVVQSTVSASGNIAATSQLDLGFKTSGTISAIDITQGQHVTRGQLLATLDPQSAEVALEQAKAGLQSAEAELAREEETDGETSSSGTSGSAANGSSAGSATASAASIAFARAAATPTPSTAAPSATAPSTSTTSMPTTGTPTTSTPATGASPASETPATQSNEASPTQSSKSEQTQATKKQAKSKASAGGSSSGSSSTPSSSATSISSATREANIASAKAAVRSERLTVKSDEQAVVDMRLLAPESGTIVSLGGEVGETVSGGGTSRDSSTSEGSSSGSSSTAGGAATGATGGSSSSSSSASSGSFAVLSNLSAMKLVVPLSESEVGSVKAGQTATVTVEALKGAKLAAHVSEVAALSTSNSGVVSYDVTFRLDQLQHGLKAGMSATAEVVVAQAEGVNVPTSAISGGAVTVSSGGKQARRAVTTGLGGDSTTLIVSGLKAGEQVVLPLASTSGASSQLSKLGGSGSGATSGALGGGLSGVGGGGFARGGLAGGAPGGGPGG
jgi:multidrug efflux pump subunit AcrA (membrane-fusion protein)